MSTTPQPNAGDTASMVDISEKSVTHRTALAYADLKLSAAHWDYWNGTDFAFPKGNAVQVAAVAAVMAAKQTPSIIPLCHPLPLTKIQLETKPNPESRVLRLQVRVKADYKTGVEMEALTACSVAALTVWDIAKNVSHELEITAVKLVEKRGGKSDL